MPRASTLLALVAAIMLVIASAPARAFASPCDPCPPDCPMMQAEAQAGASDKQGPPPASDQGACKAMAVCQAPAALPATTQAIGVTWLAADDVHQQLISARFAPSRPPDLALRPPIQL